MIKKYGFYIAIVVFLLVAISTIIYFFRPQPSDNVNVTQAILVTDDHTHKIGGFCIPSQQKTADTPTQSLRFKGYLGDSVACKNCTFPEDVTGGEIVERMRPQVSSFADIQSNSTVHNLIFNSAQSQVLSLYNGKFTITKNSAISPKWYVWGSNSNTFSANPQLSEGAALIAECDNQSSHERLNDMELTCLRYVMGDSYGVNYLFKINKSVNIAQLDQKVLQVIDSWKCASS